MNEEEAKQTCEAGELGLSSSSQTALTESELLVVGEWQWLACVFQDWNENMPDKSGWMDEKIAYELLVYSLALL